MNLSGIAKEYPKILEAPQTEDNFEKDTLFIRGGKRQSNGNKEVFYFFIYCSLLMIFIYIIHQVISSQ